MAVRYLPPAVSYDCPDWCERTDHDADVVGPSDPPIHYGPQFGPYVNVQGVDAASLDVAVDVPEGKRLGYGGIVELIRDAEKATAWARAHGSTR